MADPDRKRAVAALVAEGDRRQLADEAFRGELASWVRDPAADDGLHGIPLQDAGARVAAFPLRTFEIAGRAANTDQELAAGSPLLALLDTGTDDERAWIACGQALGHVLLRAGAEGLSASLLGQPVEVPDLRPLLAEAVGRSAYPQVLLRLGYGPPASPTPRRSVDRVATVG